MTPYAVDCPDLFSVLGKYKNVRAIFNGHDHNFDNVLMKERIPFIFDAHFGGNWGTDYRGFRIVELYDDQTIATWVVKQSESGSNVRINEAVL